MANRSRNLEGRGSALPSSLQLKEATIQFLSGLANTDGVAVTVTWRYDNQRGDAASKYSEARNCIALFLHFLDNECFNHAHRRFGFRVGSGAVVEGLGPWQRMHCHLALQRPSHITMPEFIKKVEICVNRIKSFGRETVIKAIHDLGWHRYISKDGMDTVLLECCRQEKNFPAREEKII